MPLFERLLQLYPPPRRTEDFFTEIVAHLFNNHKKLAVAWLAHLGVINLDEAQSCLLLKAATQKTFAGLNHHPNDSRPDIVLELKNQSSESLVIIESKIASSQNPSQLINYAEILEQEHEFDGKILIYITRSFEDISAFQKEIRENGLASKLKFIQTRWHLFYKFLDTYEDSYLIREIKAFMRSEKMNQDNQFSAVDILALSNFRHAFSIVDETLGGEVDVKIGKLFPGQKKTSILEAYKQLRIWPRIARYVYFTGHDFKLMLGYFELSQDSELLYPDVSVCLQIRTSSSSGKQSLEVIEKIAAESTNPWQRAWEDDPGEWPCIIIRRNLQDCLGEKDHVKEIQTFFCNGIDQVVLLREKHPELPWGD